MLVAELQQVLMDHEVTCHRTCFSLQLGGAVLDSLSELGSAAAMQEGALLRVLEDPYTVRDARLHLRHVRDLLRSLDPTDAYTGVNGSSLSYLSLYTQGDMEIEGAGRRHASEKQSVDCSPPDYVLPGCKDRPLVPLHPMREDWKPLQCLRVLTVSSWNPPPGNRKMHGDLMYLNAVTMEERDLNITASTRGFYLNQSTAFTFNPKPASPKILCHNLVDLLGQVSPAFRKCFSTLQKKRVLQHPYERIATPFQVFTWTAPQRDHTLDCVRSEETHTIRMGQEEHTAGQSRDWNEELQASRELPRNSPQERLHRDRHLFKTNSDLVGAATRGAQAVVDGNVMAINPGEEPRAHVFIWNSLFFSLGFDVRHHYRPLGGDAAAHAAASCDLRGVQAYASIDQQGLHTIGTTVVDYRGYCVTAQTIVPGILEKEQEDIVVYGSNDYGKTVLTHPRFVELLEQTSQPMRIQHHQVLDHAHLPVDLCSAVETKGILGNDGRPYILDLLRAFPPDVNFYHAQEGAEKEAEPPGEFRNPGYPALPDRNSLGFPRRHRHGLANLRAELLDAFILHRYEIFLKMVSEGLRLLDASAEGQEDPERGPCTRRQAAEEDKAEELVTKNQGVVEEGLPRIQAVEEGGDPGTRIQAEEEGGDPDTRIQAEEEGGDPGTRIQAEEEGGDPGTRIQAVEERGDPGTRIQAEEERGDPGTRIQAEEERGDPGTRIQAEEEGGDPGTRIQAVEERGDPGTRIQAVEEAAEPAGVAQNKAPDQELQRRELMRRACQTVGSISDFGFDIRFNPDVCSPVVCFPADCVQDVQKHKRLLKDAAAFLLSNQIPAILRDCLDHTALPVDGGSLTAELHLRGVNVRYLGAVLELLEEAEERERLGHVQRIAVSEVIIRSAKHIFKSYLQEVELSSLSSAVSHFLNCLLSSAPCSDSASDELQSRRKSRRRRSHGNRIAMVTDTLWARLTPGDLWSKIRKEAEEYYHYTLKSKSFQEITERFGLQKISLLREMALKTGIQVQLREYVFDSRHRPVFGEEDVVNMFPVVKHLRPTSFDATHLLQQAQEAVQHGHLKAGTELIGQALSLFSSVCGVLHTEVCLCLRLLARLSYILGEYTEALSHQEKAVLITERVQGVDHHQTIQDYSHLALYCFAGGQRSISLRLLYRARYLTLLLSGEDHPQVALLDSMLGLVLHGLQEYDLSLRFLHNALSLSSKFHGAASLKHAQSYHILATVYESKAEFRSALQHEREAYSIYKNQVGADHQSTRESSEYLKRLTQQAVLLQRAINHIYSTSPANCPAPPRFTSPSIPMILQQLNLTCNIILIPLSTKDIEDLRAELKGEKRAQVQELERQIKLAGRGCIDH
ncbi:clustered mitochondria protein homolog [Aplochiton taeniatus]